MASAEIMAPQTKRRSRDADWLLPEIKSEDAPNAVHFTRSCREGKKSNENNFGKRKMKIQAEKDMRRNNEDEIPTKLKKSLKNTKRAEGGTNTTSKSKAHHIIIVSNPKTRKKDLKSQSNAVKARSILKMAQEAVDSKTEAKQSSPKPRSVGTSAATVRGRIGNIMSTKSKDESWKPAETKLLSRSKSHETKSITESQSDEEISATESRSSEIKSASELKADKINLKAEAFEETETEVHVTSDESSHSVSDKTVASKKFAADQMKSSTNHKLDKTKLSVTSEETKIRTQSKMGRRKASLKLEKEKPGKNTKAKFRKVLKESVGVKSRSRSRSPAAEGQEPITSQGDDDNMQENSVKERHVQLSEVTAKKNITELDVSKAKKSITSGEMDKSNACDKISGTSKQHKNHLKNCRKMKNYKMDFVCDRCGKSFKTESYLNQHIRIHTGEKVCKCGICGKEFNNQGNLYTHMRIHDPERKFTCPHCGKGYNQKINLKHHLNVTKGMCQHYSEENSKYVIKCDKCSRKFSSYGRLQQHLRYHDAIKPEMPYLECEFCKKKFKTGTELERHRRVHTGVKPFSCPQCPKSFIQKGNLTAHLRVHTGDRPYVCFVCNAGFTQGTNLKIHLLKKHDVEYTPERDKDGNIVRKKRQSDKGRTKLPSDKDAKDPFQPTTEVGIQVSMNYKGQKVNFIVPPSKSLTTVTSNRFENSLHQFVDVAVQHDAANRQGTQEIAKPESDSSAKQIDTSDEENTAGSHLITLSQMEDSDTFTFVTEDLEQDNKERTVENSHSQDQEGLGGEPNSTVAPLNKIVKLVLEDGVYKLIHVVEETEELEHVPNQNGSHSGEGNSGYSQHSENEVLTSLKEDVVVVETVKPDSIQQPVKDEESKTTVTMVEGGELVEPENL